MTTTPTPTAVRPWTAPKYGKCDRCEADAERRLAVLSRQAKPAAELVVGLPDCGYCRQYRSQHMALVDRIAQRLEQEPWQPSPKPVDVPPDWPVLAPEAFHGLAGEIVRAVEPNTEADPVAVLVQLLAAFGNAVGRSAYYRVEATRHHLNLFAVLIGESSKARKGTSWGHIAKLFGGADPTWADTRVLSGLSSGEGVIWAVRDPVMATEKIKERGRIVGTQQYEADPGVTDKRLLVLEAEYANVLRQVERHGNILSVILRQAWETGNLRTLTKNTPAQATGAHVSVIGHITDTELRRNLSATESVNGFANRFLWFCVRRSKHLPRGGGIPDHSRNIQRLANALAFGRAAQEITLGDEAGEIWDAMYPELSAGRPGLAGAMLGRAEAQVIRLACVYALLDCSTVIRPPHLAAATAVWDHCAASVARLYRDATGDDVADTILQALRGSADGLSRTDISGLFGRNLPATRIAAALEGLRLAGLAAPDRQQTAGGPREQWRATK